MFCGSGQVALSKKANWERLGSLKSSEPSAASGGKLRGSMIVNADEVMV